MKALSPVFTLLFSALIPAIASAEAGASCGIAATVITEASAIRGLAAKRPVPCEIHGKKLVEEYIMSTIKTKIPPGRLAFEEEAYKALGFIPESFGYEKGIIDLYLSQIGGYYDPEKRRYIMAGWIPDIMQTTVAAHELTHALQDQHFNLETFMDMKVLRSDQLMARSALVEGDATAVMFDYTRRGAGLSGIADETSVDSLLLQNIMGAGMVSALNQIPQSLQMMLLFPYTSGLRFAHGLILRDGYQEIDRAFKRPPRTTEEILHLEKYLTDAPDYIDIADAEMQKEAPAGAKSLYTDTYGEFAISSLLAMSGALHQKIAAAAEGWGGDRADIFDAGGKHVVVWKTHWDTPEDAKQFYEIYSAGLKARFPEGVLKDGRPVKLRIDGSDVTFVHG